MSDPRTRDQQTIGAGRSEPEAMVVDLEPNGEPDTRGMTAANEIDPGRAIGGVSHAHYTSVPTGVGEATHADPGPPVPPPRADHPRLRDPGRAGPRRHGRRLPGPAGPPEPPCPEDDPGRRPRRPRGGHPLPGRGRGRRPAPAPQHRPDPPHRRGTTACPTSSWSSSRAAAWTDGSTAPPGRRDGRPRWSRRWPGPSPRRTGWGSSTAT